jgi:hypothetical protein
MNKTLNISEKIIKSKKLIVFDLDGTLVESKAVLDDEMKDLLLKLLSVKKVAVIGGGKYELFERQLIAPTKDFGKDALKNLFLFPTTSTAFYRYKNEWKNVYTLNLSKTAREKIKKSFYTAISESSYKKPEKVYGEIIEDRGTQITFSAIGQNAPVVEKEKWNKTSDVREEIVAKLKKLIPEFEVHIGGLTSIDVTRKGIDKAYGIRQIEKRLKIPIKEMMFIGDAMQKGGNDYAVKKTGVFSVAIKDPEETKLIIKRIISFSIKKNK